MGYTFKCKDIGLQCDFEANAESTGDLVKQATTHAMSAHRAEAMMLAAKIKDAIKKT